MSNGDDVAPASPAGDAALAKDPTGQKRQGKNLAVGWIAKISMIISGFVLPRLISDNLGATQLGIWDFGWSLVAYFRLFGMGLASGLNRYVARYDAENEPELLKQIVATAGVIQIGVALIT
ncbi:MAG: hypothetical protein AAF004_14340, partial [Pseudomonadota bacterium]